MQTPTPAPQLVIVNPIALRVLLGHVASARLLSPPSGIVMLSGNDENIAHAVFNPIDRTIDSRACIPARPDDRHRTERAHGDARA